MIPSPSTQRITKYQRQRRQFWPDVEQFFSNLPPGLFQQGALLKNNLAIACTATGQFQDILSREQDYPLLYLHFWLLDDLRQPAGPQRNQLERQLFLAMTFAFAAIFTHESILDETASFDASYQFLAQRLHQQADQHLRQLCPQESPFWRYHHAFWQEYAEAQLLATGPQHFPANVATALAGRLAFAKIPLAAVAISAGQEAILPKLCRLMDRLNAVFQILRDIAALRRDAMRRHITHPIAQIMQAANIRPGEPFIPERLLGAAVLTGAVARLCRECLDSLQACQAEAHSLKLPTFAGYAAATEDLARQVESLFSLKSGGDTPATPGFSFAPYVDPLAQAIGMAQDYLLSDLTFRESWEVQRGDRRHSGQVTATAFPVGLVVEQLCHHGHDMSAQVDRVFEALRQNDFRYYPLPDLPPDADDLGLLLRLLKYAAPERQPGYRAALQAPLQKMKEHILPSGQIPVWFGPTAGEYLIWGNSCAATEINLLLGLIDFDAPGYAQIIQASALNLLRRLAVNGLGAALYYPPPYTLWVAFELIDALNQRPLPPALAQAITQVVPLLTNRLELELSRPVSTSQDMAFFCLTCLTRPRLKHFFNDARLTQLCQRQRYDGSWNGEPLFLVPDWRGTAWYASRTVTTAFCYRALKSWQATKN